MDAEALAAARRSLGKKKRHYTLAGMSVAFEVLREDLLVVDTVNNNRYCLQAEIVVFVSDRALTF